MNVLNDLALWFWRLLPANPILVRVVTAGGKRIRHFWARLVYLGALVFVMLLAGNLTRTNASLADLAKDSTQTFMYVSIVQLFLMAFIAPVFTAGAITQEKDGNTFSILLTTPLSNAQIVLGSLLSRLYFVWVLLLAGVPIFSITMIYGGVTTSEVFESMGLAACTGLVTGSLAILIGMLKVGTRRTIFSFFLGIAVYLLGVGAIGWYSPGWLPEAPLGIASQRRMSWLAPIHPFLALEVVTGRTPAPPIGDVWHYGWPQRWLLAYPQYGYMLLTSLASVLMVVLGLFFVRRGSKEGEAQLGARVRQFFIRGEAAERTRKPRRVWRNPIAWREASTRASAGGRSLSRWLFIIGGIAVAIVLLVAAHGAWKGLTLSNVNDWLVPLIWIELAIILLVVTNTAASTLTREKEALTMELLLTTPLTSHYIIAGMLQGLVRFVLPMIAVPTITLALFVVDGLIRRDPGGVTIEAVLLVPLMMTAFAAVAALVGLQQSLNCKKTVQAVMISTSIVLGASGLLWLCGVTMGRAGATLAAVVMPFTPFPAVAMLLDLGTAFAPGATISTAELVEVRIVRLITSLISIAMYAAITFSLYKAMVRSFDMTVRRQSA